MISVAVRMADGIAVCGNVTVMWRGFVQLKLNLMHNSYTATCNTILLSFQTHKPRFQSIRNPRLRAWLPRFGVYKNISTLCLKKNIPDVFSYNSRKHWRIFIIFGRNVTEKASNHMFYIFPPHLINASTLPCETENTEIVSFPVNVACWFANRHTSHIRIIT